MKKISLLLAGMTFMLCLKAQNAFIRETTMSFRTYGYSDPNPIAKPGKIYPYFRFDGYTNNPVDQDWKIIEMENDWIRVLIAPEIGGKVLGAIEKSTGNEFLYLNKVIKFRDVAMRGAWTSGGIEFNFGAIGHAPSTASPVDYLIQENPDGSVSCFLGSMDLSSRTEWRVEVRLPADKAWFETHASWYNPSDFSTSKYHWMNAAAAASEDLSYYWPGSHYIGHGGDSHAWPIMADGRDISQYAQNDYGTYHSYHVLGEVADYYGGYYNDKDFGFGHLTDYAVKPGKKIWIWGLARQGEIWVDLLTDPDLGNGQYTEIQTGLLFNQAAEGSSKTPYKHLSFKSKEVERFTEYWFPVKETGGITDINEYGILNAVTSGESRVASRSAATIPIDRDGEFRVASEVKSEFRFCALQAVQDSIHILGTEGQEYAYWLNLEPMETVQFSVVASEKSGNHDQLTGIRFDLTRHYSDRPVDSPPFDWNSLQGKYLAAMEHSRQRNYTAALKGFYDCLITDLYFMPALVGAAEEQMRIMEYEQAENLLRRALSVDTYHPQANYLLGIVKKEKGENHQAIEAFGLSTRSMEYRSAAFSQLAEVSLCMNDYPRALRYGESALDYNRFNINAYQIMTVALRLSGQIDEARHTAEGLLQFDPLNHLGRFELYLLDTNEASLDSFQSAIRTEFREQVFLELALFYQRLKVHEDALHLLELAPDQVLVSYLKYHLQSLLSENEESIESETQLQSLYNQDIDFVFPYRPELFKAIEWAERQAPHWKNRYYMGIMRLNFGQLDEARQLMKSCGDEPETAAFYLARTKLFEGQDTELVVHDLERALKVQPDDWRSFQYSIDFFMKHGAYPQALEFARRGARKFQDNFIIQTQLAKVELYNNNYSKCLNILDKLVILPAEGAQEGHDLYRQAHLLTAVEAFKAGKEDQALAHIAKAREWPEQLGVGKAFVTDERIEDYLVGIIHLSQTQDEAAANSLNKILEYSDAQKPGLDSPNLLLALSLQLLGQEEDAIKLLSHWIKSKPSDPIAHWAMAMYANNREQAEQALSKYKAPTGGTPWNPSGADAQFKLVYEIVNQIQLK